MADLFCGGGGFSRGALRAAAKHGLNLRGIAVNHWQIAISTHEYNHPQLKHMCANVDHVHPLEVVPSGRLDLLLASPECTHHSRARGGRPMNDQSRASAWVILRWLEMLDVTNVLIENVPEFQDWCRLSPKTGRPIKKEKGRLFLLFIENLRALGYNVDWRVLNAANYGAVTTRERLFIQCRKGRRKITWPEPTHIKPKLNQMAIPSLDNRKPWRPVREILDFSIKGKSVFQRKKPLSPNTMRRIVAGLEKFNGLTFITNVSHSGANGKYVYGLDEQLSTQTTRQEHMLVEPMILQIRGGQDKYVRGVPASEPMQTLTTDPAMMLIEPILIGMGGNRGTAHPKSTREPLQTQTTENHLALVQGSLMPMLLGQQSGATARSIDEQMPTIASAGAIQKIDAFLMAYHGGNGSENRTSGVNEPIGVQDTSNRYSLVEPFLVEPFLLRYFGSEKDGQSIDEPLSTVTAIGKHSLVYPIVQARDGKLYLLDIHTRMLTTQENARGMGFGDDYKFYGTKKEQMRQIGNAVEVNLSDALVSALIQAETEGR